MATAIKIAIMEMTTRSSINVKADFRREILDFSWKGIKSIVYRKHLIVNNTGMLTVIFC